MDDRELEYYKHRLRIREILLDKLGLAVLVGVLLFAGNWLMKTYESKLQTQLDQLKEVYNFQRILVEKDIAAHDEVWKAIATFRYKANTYLGKRATDENVAEVQAAGVELVRVVDGNEIYLTPATRAAVNELTETRLNKFAEKWVEDGDDGLSETSLKFLGQAIDKVRMQVEADIKARRAAQSTTNGNAA